MSRDAGLLSSGFTLFMEFTLGEFELSAPKIDDTSRVYANPKASFVSDRTEGKIHTKKRIEQNRTRALRDENKNRKASYIYIMVD